MFTSQLSELHNRVLAQQIRLTALDQKSRGAGQENSLALESSRDISREGGPWEAAAEENSNDEELSRAEEIVRLLPLARWCRFIKP